MNEIRFGRNQKITLLCESSLLVLGLESFDSHQINFSLWPHFLFLVFPFFYFSFLFVTNSRFDDAEIMIQIGFSSLRQPGLAVFTIDLGLL